MKLFGLRLSRVREFLFVVGHMRSRPAAYKGLIKGAWGVIRYRKEMPPRGLVKWRLRTCLKCPCRAGGYRRGQYPLRCMECGCYIPYKVSSVPYGNPCPINETDPERGWQ